MKSNFHDISTSKADRNVFWCQNWRFGGKEIQQNIYKHITFNELVCLLIIEEFLVFQQSNDGHIGLWRHKLDKYCLYIFYWKSRPQNISSATENYIYIGSRSWVIIKMISCMDVAAISTNVIFWTRFQRVLGVIFFWYKNFTKYAQVT